MVNKVDDSYDTLIQFLYRLPIGVMEISNTGIVEMLNPMSAQLLMPLTVDASLDNIFPVFDSVAPEIKQMMLAFDQPSGVICDSHRVDLRSQHNGRNACQMLSVSMLKLDSARFMITLTDITTEVQREDEKMARRLSDAERVDSLTKMPNRRAVHEHLKARMEQLQTVAGNITSVLFINCDRFKQINDAFGQVTGDQVLIMLGERLGTAIRQANSTSPSTGLRDIAARTGSDEFVLVLGGIQLREDVISVARRVLDVLGRPYATAHRQITCTASMGIVMLTEPIEYGGDADTVLQDASMAMSEAKRAGGGRYAIFDPLMRKKAAERGCIEVELRRAIAEQELFVVYQPVVGLLADGRIDRCAGVEALVRWRHPSKGIIPPVQFIGIAEECGLIGALGDFVLEAACADFVQWQKNLGAFAPRTLAVNLSRAQLAIPEWHLKVRDILQLTGMPSEQLQLEVTESLAAQDAMMQKRLKELKSLGLKLALDDFGTGYSSLACLHLLPVDSVKIDRSFVSQADVSAHHRVLIDATVRVAHSLGMNTVAEGIETDAQAAAIKMLACDKGQGYFYSRPLPADELAIWVASTQFLQHMVA